MAVNGWTWAGGVSFAVVSGADVVTSRLALAAGGVEANGLVGVVAARPAEFVAIKVCVALVLLPLWWVLHRVRPWLVGAALLLLAAELSPTVAANVVVIRDLHGAPSGARPGPALLDYEAGR